MIAIATRDPLCPWAVHAGRVTHPHWPLLDLRVSVADLMLSPLVEADLDEVVRRLPDDVEQNPDATRFAVPDGVHRAVVVHQEYWRSYGTWTVGAWRFHLAARRDGELLGLQELEGNDFPTLRTVDTSSWLVPGARGSGLGKAMRRAVLTLAFDHLGALAALTSAWRDNTASLGVSRALGYRPNGESFLARPSAPDGVDTLVHMRMTREQWLACAGSEGVAVEGVDAVRPWFGLAGQ
jgi:RimJ/RimL family protein N-acetyltransferase